MGNFNRDRDSRNSNRSDNGRDYGTRGFDRPQMFKATCSNCGNECEVPFRPTGGKPVLCSSCFEKSGGRDAQRNDRPSFRNDSRRPSFDDRPMYDAVCANCKKLCQIPFQPRVGKPVFCRDCFSKQDNPRNNDNQTQAPQRSENSNSEFQYKKQFDSINYKLDKLLRLLDQSTPEPEAKAEAVTPLAKVVAVAEEAVKELKEKKVAKKKTVVKKKAPAKKKA
jgi:CxxC-x17-CxxC domain-containing protein